jgi:hypothetical protein
VKGSDELRLLAWLADDGGVPALAAEAAALAERLREGRFYVCAERAAGTAAVEAKLRSIAELRSQIERLGVQDGA